jgi:hypothetical protein
MIPSHRTTGDLRQRPLQFPAAHDRVEPWDGLSEPQQQGCRLALRQMLVAVVLHSRVAFDDHLESIDQGPEKCTND